MIINIISKKYGHQKAIVDDEDYESLKGWSFHVWTTPRHSGFYLMGYSPDDRVNPKRVHRFIANAKPGEIVDHINGDPLDNRRCNLRVTTSLINNRNARKRKDGVHSKHKGVCRTKNQKSWISQINLDGKRANLGTFKTEVEAAKAYNDAIDRYKLEGAIKNIIISET